MSQLIDNYERLAPLVPRVKDGLSMLFSRRYRARTALVTIPWFLMDIATYGAGLFTPTILGAIEISERSGGITAHDFALAERSPYRFVFANRFRAWSLDRSTVRPHPNAGPLVLQAWLWEC